MPPAYGRTVAEFVVELYVGGDPATLVAGAKRARAAAVALARDGIRVRFTGSIHLPEDETGLFLYEATSEADVRAAADRAGLAYERVVPAVSRPIPPAPAHRESVP